MQNEKDIALYNHVKKEQLLSITSYNQLSETMSCDNEVKVYRGLSFRTKQEFEDFKEKLESGEYKPNLPESFSRVRNTAEEFSRTKKTLFPYEDKNILIEHDYQKITNENIAVYAGVVIELVVPAGKGIDVNKSDIALEDEVIYQTNEKIEYNYEIIESFETKLEKSNLDINKYIKEAGVKDKFSKYLISNKSKDLNKEVQFLILENTINNLENYKPQNSYYLTNDKNVVVVENEGTMLDEEEIKIEFNLPKLFLLYKQEILTDNEVLLELENKVNNIIEQVCEFIESEYNYAEREASVHYNIDNLVELSHLANEEQRERIKSINYMTSPKTIDMLNEDIRGLNYRNDLSRTDKEKIVQKKTEEIKNFLMDKVNNVPKSKELVEQEIEKERIKKTNLKNKIKRIRNS